MWAGLAATLVGMSKGGLPTVGMLSVPILSLYMSPIKAVVMLLPIYIISDTVGLWLYRKAFSAINLKILVPAGILGIWVGWLTATMVSDAAVKAMIGVMGVGFVANAWRQRKTVQITQPARWGRGIFWGGVSGFASFISHAGGPPFQVYLLPQKLPKLVFIPFALLGTVVGAYLTRKIADDWFFKWVQVGLLLVSLKLILDVVSA